MTPPKRFVYVLRSVLDPAQHYVGLTADVSARLDAHNAGLSVREGGLLHSQILNRLRALADAHARADGDERSQEIGIVLAGRLEVG